MPKFFIEQVALAPRDPVAAIRLLEALGMKEWARDIVVAKGTCPAAVPAGEDSTMTNVAALAFNYEATRGLGAGQVADPMAKPLELEVLHYDAGPNWVESFPAPAVSHFGMHCTDAELKEFREVFKRFNVRVAQEVNTVSHVNPVIAGKKWYTYVIFDTRSILGVDLKFIVRRDAPVPSFR